MREFLDALEHYQQAMTADAEAELENALNKLINERVERKLKEMKQ